MQIKPVTGIGPVFEPWQGPALTTILHRQKLGYMRTHLDDILAPRQAALILATEATGRVFTIPQNWFECPITPYLLNPLSKDRRRRFRNSISAI